MRTRRESRLIVTIYTCLACATIGWLLSTRFAFGARLGRLHTSFMESSCVVTVDVPECGPLPTALYYEDCGRVQFGFRLPHYECYRENVVCIDGEMAVSAPKGDDNDFYYVRVRLPLWMPWSILCIMSALMRHRYRSISTEGRCTKCQYNLLGNTSGRCPECGTRIDANTE